MTHERAVGPRDHIDPDDLLERLARGEAPVVLDVRSAAEFAAGHVPGARHLPFWKVWLARRAPALPPDRPIVVYCGHGPRARLAAAGLRRFGFRRILLLAGHMAGWRRARHIEES